MIARQMGEHRSDACIARNLGIHKEALRQWVCQAEADQGDGPICSPQRRRASSPNSTEKNPS
ncbi:hypothetical protein [Streptomyces sp. NPDC001401]|uniref:hypothetical protein n=1 Tax=Streptomyces sp. NPDC001401 TaxID=3364570 RepID=UPI003686243D